MDVLKDGLVVIERDNYETKGYIPWLKLDQLCGPENVKKAIKESGVETYQQEEAIQLILYGGKKVFAILISIGYPALIVKFMEQDHLQHQPLDAKLPFSSEALSTFLDQVPAMKFYRAQWKLSAPFFRGDLSHRNFNKAAILPFVYNKRRGSGAFGMVYEIAIDPEHQAYSAGANLPPVCWIVDLLTASSAYCVYRT
jgi:hypothetical protein